MGHYLCTADSPDGLADQLGDFLGAFDAGLFGIDATQSQALAGLYQGLVVPAVPVILTLKPCESSVMPGIE
jgi:hypothetical protein